MDRRPPVKMKKRILFLIPLAFLLVGAGLFALRPRSAAAEAGATYKTEPIVRGDIVETVSSTGSVEAVGSVGVLAQLSGTLEDVLVDFNDRVTKGQALAKINTDKLKITLKEQEAALQKARAQHEYDQGEYEKSQKLYASALISESDLAAKKLANLTSGAVLAQAEAAYDEVRLDLDTYAVIRSPIDGIVLNRAVEVGDTVVGSGSSPTKLFTLAANLKDMDIQASVDELDISRVRVGQKATFTVEAYPDKKFEGTVRQIRVVPSSKDNVVSYTVIVRADNPDGLLLPGMTATLEFVVTEKKNAVLVPSAAFRFTPSEAVQAAARRVAFEERIAELPEDQKAEALKKYDEMAKSGSPQANSLLAPRRIAGAAGGQPPTPKVNTKRRDAAGRAAATAAAEEKTKKTLWLLEPDGTVTVKNVTVGASDATKTEILKGDSLVGAAAILRAN